MKEYLSQIDLLDAMCDMQVLLVKEMSNKEGRYSAYWDVLMRTYEAIEVSKRDILKGCQPTCRIANKDTSA